MFVFLSAGKIIRVKPVGRRGRPPKMPNKVGRPRKNSKLTVKSGKLVVRCDDEILEPEVEFKEECKSDEAMEEQGQHEQIIEVDSESTRFNCALCGKEFSSSEFLARHIETHGVGGDGLKCDLCDKSFFTTDSLVKHKKLHKGKKNMKRKPGCPAFDITHIKHFKCRQCSKVFTTKSKADDHERTHTGEKPFECDICGTCFRQKSNLSSHKRVTHLQEKRYKCELCDKAFKWKRLLNGHRMSVHTGERPYKCEFCEAGFVYQQHYKKHMRIHTGEKPFRCLICDKAFNSSNNCKAHMFTHSDTKPYECSLCGAGFMRKPLILSHIKQHAHMENMEATVKVNSPVAVLAAVEGNGGGSSVKNVGGSGGVRKKKLNRESTQGGVMQMPEGPPQQAQNNVEETVHQFIIPGEHREVPASGETLGYTMFTPFPASQGTISHYAPLNLGQW